MNKRSFLLLMLMMFPFPGTHKHPEQRGAFPHSPALGYLPDGVA
jgi:hypothetical protein